VTFTEASIMGKLRKCPCGAVARKGEACPACGETENEENSSVKEGRDDPERSKSST
jgi:hypothetical protein